MPQSMRGPVIVALLMALFITCAGAVEPAGGLDLHVIPLPVNSYRLLAMSRDADGFIWAGSIHRMIHRYDPRTSKVKSIPLPYESTASSCICVGNKLYILGQSYPSLIIYDRVSGAFSTKAYPSPAPNVWYGTEAVDGQHFYLFDRASTGLIKWDTQTDTGAVIPWPYKVPLPSGGRLEPRDNSLWCHVWDFTDGKYIPVGIARLDLATDTFTEWHAFPQNDADLKPFSDAQTTFFLPYSLKGKLVSFDFKQKRWGKFLPVPRYGELFGFMGGPVMHKDRCYFSLSTYNGTEVGCDGKPYHFCNAVLEFDPAARQFEFLTLESGQDRYYQVAYLLSADGEFFATGSNIREQDGSLNRDRAGEIVIWQTKPPK